MVTVYSGYVHCTYVHDTQSPPTILVATAVSERVVGNKRFSPVHLRRSAFHVKLLQIPDGLFRSSNAQCSSLVEESVALADIAFVDRHSKQLVAYGSHLSLKTRPALIFGDSSALRALLRTPKKGIRITTSGIAVCRGSGTPGPTRVNASQWIHKFKRR